MAKIKLDKLKKELDKKYQNPVLLELKKLEKEKQNVLDGFAGLNTSKNAISDLQTTLASSTFQGAFKTINDYAKYTNPLLDDIRKKDYVSLRKELNKSLTPYIKTEVERAMEALSYTEKSLLELSKGIYPDADKYSRDISSALKNMGINNNLLEPAKSLTESMKKIETNMFQDKMEKLNAQRLEIPKMMEPVQIPKNPMINQNEQIIKLLDIQNETLVSVGKYISSQNEKLDTQNKIVEEEIGANKVAAKQAFWTAVISIFISIIATLGAIWISYDIYTKEDVSSNKQHAELLQSITRTKKSDTTQKQTNILNKILMAIESKNGKISKNLYDKLDKVE